MNDWIEVHVVNVAGYGLVNVMSDYADNLESLITILGLAALGWYNIERALRVRRDRAGKRD